MSSPNTAMRKISYGQAIKEAVAEEMRRDEAVIVMGEDVAEAGTVFKVWLGLVDEFGTDRVIDTPISESGITGLGVGLAITGMRPIVDIMFSDMTTLVLDQMANQAAKTHYMTGGKLSVPMVLHTTIGGQRRAGAQHSQALHAWTSHIPGLKVAIPSNAYDAKGLFKSAIRDNNPCVIYDNKTQYPVKWDVPEDDYLVPFGVADIKREGTDITIVAISRMVLMALEAAEMLAEIGISAEVVDPRTTSPLDKDTIIASAKKTSRAIVIDEGYNHFGASAEIAATIMDGAFYYLDAPVKRMAAMDVPVPFSPDLEDATLPSPQKIFDLARTVCGKA